MQLLTATNVAVADSRQLLNVLSVAHQDADRRCPDDCSAPVSYTHVCMSGYMRWMAVRVDAWVDTAGLGGKCVHCKSEGFEAHSYMTPVQVCRLVAIGIEFLKDFLKHFLKDCLKDSLRFC